mgnify:CR=1 FL=1
MTTIVADPSNTDARSNMTNICKGIALQFKKLKTLAESNLAKDALIMSVELIEQYNKLYDAGIKDAQDGLDTYAASADKDPYVMAVLKNLFAS